MMLGIKTKRIIARPLLLFQEERQTVSYFLKNVHLILCFIIFKTRVRGGLTTAALNANE